MKVLIGVQARTNSTRLPGKVYEKIGDQTVLEWVWSAALEAHRRCNAYQMETIPAILGPASDQALEEFCKKKGLRAHFPLCPEDDLLKRYLESAKALDCNYIIRITSDCWQMHPLLISEVVQLLSKFDYVSNTVRRSFVEGWDLQACSLKALHWFDKYQVDEREHPFIHFDTCRHVRQSFEKAGFRFSELLNPELSFLFKGTSLDTIEDLERARKFHENQKADKRMA